jgi:arylsulfatase A-like enzyme
VSPHADYSPPPPYDTAFTARGASSIGADIESLARAREKGVRLSEADVSHLVGLYDGEVAWVDELVGRVLARLAELDLEGTTLVVFTADHGEDLYEHNRYFFHSPSVYRSSMQIPLVLALPGVLPAGEATDHAASITDVAPTILGLLGLPAVSRFQGENLLPGRALPAKPVRELVFGETNGSIYALRSAEWRFVFNPSRLQPSAPGGTYPIAEVELYDERADPQEQKNLAAARPDLVRALTAEVLAWKKRYLQSPVPSQGLDPEALDELRALGYVK